MSSLPYLLCGCLSQVDDHEIIPWSPATLRQSKSSRRNPYSSRGLDKFEAVLVELEVKKKKIVAQLGLQDGDAWVRFVQSNLNDWVPIVVKVKHHKAEKKGKPWLKTAPTLAEKTPEKNSPAAGIGREVKKSISWKMKEGDGHLLRLRWSRSYYWPMLFLLILVCVVLIGRSFGIVCTSIWWFMVPNMKGNDKNMWKPMKKEFGRRNCGDHLNFRKAESKKLGVS